MKSMKRVWHILILGALLSIGSVLWSRVAPALSLPPTVAHWSIEGSQTCAKPAPVNFPLWPGTSGARLVCRAEYAGSPEMTLTIYVMPDAPRATAFGPFQDWLTGPKQPGKSVFPLSRLSRHRGIAKRGHEHARPLRCRGGGDSASLISARLQVGESELNDMVAHVFRPCRDEFAEPAPVIREEGP
jgi:hypothetical protein